MEIKRRKFQGVLNILSFNRHFYVLGLGALLLLSLWHMISPWPQPVYYLVLTAFLYGLIMPLIVSAYVYDFSKYYNLQWLNQIVSKDAKPELMLNINAGFDETSFLLHHRYPNAELKVFDFYEASRHTEPAIIRARKVTQFYPGTQIIDTGKIPVADKCAEFIFLLSAVHEIRKHEEKVKFLSECKRVCKPGGKVIMVEHLRDFPNFVAFSIGFTHFFSSLTWRKAFSQAGFSPVNEKKFTPFMSVFIATV